MKALLIALVAVAAISMVTFTMMKKTAPTLSVAHIPEEVQKAFSNWKSQLGKVYDGEEESYRLNVFYANYKFVNSHQSREYELGLNEFADLSTQEFAKFYLGFKGEKKPATNIFVSNVEDVPASVDWRTSNKVSAVKNQGQCGSCWAFSTTGSLESEAAIHGTGLNSFSEQQLVDCSTAQGNQGCNGGLMDDAFTYVIAKGITTESAYPYEGVDQDCKTDGGAFKISKFTDIAAGDCDSLKAAIAQQPVSIAVDAVTWQFYVGGVFPSYLCGKSLDHGVLAVGYNAKGQWIVKNSWGKLWGQKGYITLGKGNACGLCNAASFPSI